MNKTLHQAQQQTRLKKRWMQDIKPEWQLYVILFFPLLWLIVFSYVPMYGILISFTKYNIANGLLDSKWIGLENFYRFFSTPSAMSTVTNTVRVSLYALIAGIPCPIILAILLNECRLLWFKKSVQMVTYAPYFISTVVLVAMMFQMFDQHNGIVNQFIKLFGFKSINFMSKRNMFRHMYVWSGVWQGTGFNAIIYISALNSVDPSLHEAAMIDGATRLQRIRYIDMPGIIPTAVILFILSCGSIMNVGFEKVFLMQNSANLRVSEVLSTYIYKMGLINLDYGYSSAVNLFNSCINLILVVFVNSIARKAGDTSLW
ncbi:MAG: ABC transporter permease [Christensenellales bacterium]